MIFIKVPNTSPFLLNPAFNCHHQLWIYQKMFIIIVKKSFWLEYVHLYVSIKHKFLGDCKHFKLSLQFPKIITLLMCISLVKKIRIVYIEIFICIVFILLSLFSENYERNKSYSILMRYCCPHSLFVILNGFRHYSVQHPK